MACIRKRRGVWVLDYRDATGTRRMPSFHTRAEAEDQADRVGAFAHRGRRTPAVDSQTTVATYAARWLAEIEGNVKARSHEGYAQAVTLYSFPGSARGVWLTCAAPKSGTSSQIAAGSACAGPVSRRIRCG